MGTDLLGEIRREIDARLLELRPALKEYEQLLHAAQVLDAEEKKSPPGRRRAAAAGAPSRPPSKAAARPAPKKTAARAIPGKARDAILGALEHGSHTVSELAVVTAMSTASINGNLRKLAADGAVAKTQREGKTAWTLAANG